MYDKIAQMCAERVNEIGVRLDELALEAGRLKQELDSLNAMREVLQKIEGGVVPDPSDNTSDTNLNEPMKRLANIIRLNPGISTKEISAKGVGINGQSLSNRLSELQQKGIIGNGGTKRPGGARWFAK